MNNVQTNANVWYAQRGNAKAGSHRELAVQQQQPVQGCLGVHLAIICLLASSSTHAASACLTELIKSLSCSSSVEQERKVTMAFQPCHEAWLMGGLD